MIRLFAKCTDEVKKPLSAFRSLSYFLSDKISLVKPIHYRTREEKDIENYTSERKGWRLPLSALYTLHYSEHTGSWHGNPNHYH